MESSSESGKKGFRIKKLSSKSNITIGIKMADKVITFDGITMLKMGK